ncbi:MAG: hypothetical protein ABIL11_10150 [Chloroflexota bacterium]
MEAVTYSQVQELVKRLPAKKLPLAYSLLVDLVDRETDIRSPQHHFILLPLKERHRILTEQAEQMLTHYEQTADERHFWQSGDFMDGD